VLGIHLVQVFHDRQRLGQHPIAVKQAGDQLLRVHLLKFRRMLFATVANQMHRMRLVRQLLQVQRDTHPIGST
jgi:hypothetical protein